MRGPAIPYSSEPPIVPSEPDAASTSRGEPGLPTVGPGPSSSLHAGEPDHRSAAAEPHPPAVPGPEGQAQTDPADEPPDDPSGVRGGRRRRVYLVGAVVGLVVAAIVVVNVVHVGYFMLAPGSARRTQELVAIDGHTAYRDDSGTVSYTTVSFSQATLWNKLTSRFDESVDLVDEDTILQGKNPDQNRKENLEMMDASKQEATVVALHKLGYKVTEKGTGAVVAGFSDGEGPGKSQLAEGDAIVELDGATIKTREDLAKGLGGHKPGDEVTLTVEPDRSGRRDTKKLTLAARPDRPDAGFLGVLLVTRDLDFDLPFKVSIDSGQVGGPSAGLAFTLGIIDVLTPGSLTGGTRVATTGTIDLNGHVGPVGGVKQKTFAVRASGATLFLVPPEEYEEATQWAGGDLKVVRVETVDQALDAIAANGGDTAPVAEAAAANQRPPAN